MSRPQSRKSKNIQKLIKAGLKISEIMKKGYSKETVRYYYTKINKPEMHANKLSKIMALNKARREKSKQELSTV